MHENEIKKTCLSELKKIPVIKKIKLRKMQSSDFDLLILLKSKDSEYIINIEIKPSINRQLLTHLNLLKNETNKLFMIFSKYINPSIAEELRKKEINFIDTSGNIYLHIPNYIYIFQKGNKSINSIIYKKTNFTQPKSLQFLSCILINNDAINLTVRELSETTGVSIGRISELKNDLISEGYLIKRGKRKYKLIKKPELFQKWLTNYKDTLRPSLLFDTYRISNKKFDSFTKFLNNNYSHNTLAFGGEFAAKKMFEYYNPHIIDLYIKRENLNSFLSKLNLVPASNNFNIRLYNLFSEQIKFDQKLIHPIFIYAELLCSNDDRGRQTAKLVYDNYIKNYFN